ncbi:MAG: hypothetical protein AB7U82_15660 [Blastocatellales bacterium]
MGASHKLTQLLFTMLALMALASASSAADPGLTEPTLGKTAPATVLAGSNITYTITLTNGGFALNTVTVSDSLPANTRFVSVAVSPAANWTCTTPAVGANGTVSCSRVGAVVAASETATFTIVAGVCPEVACDTQLSNQASLTVVNPPRNITSPTRTTTVQSQSDLFVSGSVSPAPALAGSDVVYTLTVTNNGPSNSANTVVTDTLPPGFTAISATSSLGSCSGVGTGNVTCSLGTLGAPNQCAVAGAPPTSATITIIAHVPAVTPPGVYGNAVAASSGNCLPDPDGASSTINLTVDQTLPGPGGFYNASSEMSATKAGSILLFAFYISDASDPNSTNTRINITNTNSTRGVALHLFFVDGQSCSVADAFLCLTANQTTSFLMSDVDPGTSGYIMAVAVDGPAGFAGGANTGCPISFNHLIGNANLKLVSSPKREADLEAESCAAVYGSPLPGCNPNNPTATLPFNGLSNGYNRLPRVLAASNIPSRADGNDTMLIITRIGGNLATGAATIGSLFGALYDDAENPHSFTINSGACQVRGSLSNTFPRIAPRFETVIPSGRSGWMRIWGANDIGIIGATLNRNDNKHQVASAFEGGHLLHKLTLTNTVTVTIPVFPPTC